ncbi:Cullin repeat-like-containing domain protein [Limtongia smithiae]|uniref:Cullin repeat-like-containing domain protein n=1 Tax=Limtongia smithiae TaxID=1125753 RepID=UPI0034CE76D8
MATLTDVPSAAPTPLSRLDSALQQSDRLAQQIAASLNRLGQASTAIESAIKPISGSTQTYSNVSKHIESTIAELDLLRTHQAVFEEEEARIRRGNLEVVECLQSIRKLQAAIAALDGSTLKSSQQVTLKMQQLITFAVGNIRDRYRKILATVSVYPPVKIAKDDTPVADGKFDCSIAPDTLQSLSTMVDFFTLTDSTVTVPLYVDARSTFIIRRLTTLSEAAVNFEIKGDYEKGSSQFRPYIDAVLSVLKNESKNIEAVFKSPAAVQAVASATLKDVEKNFANTVAALTTQIRKNMIRDCFYAYDLIELVHFANGELLLSVENPPFSLEGASKMLRKTAQDSFTEMLMHIETIVQALPQLPLDFQVLDITKQTASWLVRLEDYDSILAPLLIPLGPPSAWSLKLTYQQTLSTAATGGTPKNSYMGPEILALYISECLDDLLGNIEAKARVQYKKVTRVGLQVVANLLYVERTLKGSQDLWPMVSTGGGSERLEKIRKRALNMFLEGWEACAHNLLDVTVVRTNTASSRTTMSTRDREQIKEKFKNFNADFEDLVAKFREYSFRDAELKGFLVKELSLIIVPLYNRFYEKYKGGEFSKHADKYIKYNKTQLETALKALQQ